MVKKDHTTESLFNHEVYESRVMRMKHHILNSKNRKVFFDDATSKKKRKRSMTITHKDFFGAMEYQNIGFNVLQRASQRCQRCQRYHQIMYLCKPKAIFASCGMWHVACGMWHVACSSYLFCETKFRKKYFKMCCSHLSGWD